MSDKKHEPHGAEATVRAESRPYTPSYTFSEIERMAQFFKAYLASDQLIRWSIIAAGLAGALEIARIVWLAIRFVARF